MPPEPGKLESWQKALASGRLSPEQVKVLEDMVARGEAASLEIAAQRLDWHESVISPDEHYYGF